MTVGGEDAMSLTGFSVWKHLIQLRDEDPSAVAGELGSGTMDLQGHLTTTVPSLPTMAGLLYKCQFRFIFSWKTVPMNKL